MTLKTAEGDVEIVDRKVAYQGYFRIDRYRLRHRLHVPRADGNDWSRELTRELFERGHVAAVLPYDPARDEVVLIEQFRIGAYAAGRPPWLVEIVAGIIEEGEDAETVARRETREETGLAVGDLVPICDYLVSPGGTSETVALFCGRVDASKAGGIHGHAGEDEDIRVFPLSVAEAARRLGSPATTSGARQDGPRFDNAMTIIALQWLMLHRDELRARWH